MYMRMRLSFLLSRVRLDGLNRHLPRHLLLLARSLNATILPSFLYKTPFYYLFICMSGPPSHLPLSLSVAMAPELIDPPSNKVCVMDAAGHLGSGLVERLLRRGYTVHAAVQKQGLRFRLPICLCHHLRLHLQLLAL